MPYTLKTSDGAHSVLGTSNGNREDLHDGSFWITGWPPGTQANVDVGAFYLLEFPDGHSNPVEVVQKGGLGMGGLRFRFTG
jgi:hypothetical protein